MSKEMKRKTQHQLYKRQNYDQGFHQELEKKVEVFNTEQYQVVIMNELTNKLNGSSGGTFKALRTFNN